MAKRIIFIAVWTEVFYSGSRMLLGYASGLFFAAQTSGGGQVSERTTTIVGISWALVPMIMGSLGLFLGISGKLPGTRRQMITVPPNTALEPTAFTRFGSRCGVRFTDGFCGHGSAFRH